MVAVIWGVNIAVMKLAIIEIDYYAFNAIRLSLSALTLAVCVWVENKTRSTYPAESAPGFVRKWITIVAFGVLTGGVYQIVFVIGMSKTTASNTALIMSAMPMWTAVLSFLWLREKLGRAWIGLMLAFVGTVIVTLAKGTIGLESENLTGNLLILIASLAWACAAVVSRPMMRFISPIRLAFYATIGTLPLHFMMPGAIAGIGTPSMGDPKMIAIMLYSGIFSTGLAYAMWNYGVQQIGPSQASIYQNLVPLVALLAAWFFLSEQISVSQLIGGSLILFGLFVTRRLRPKLSPPAVS